MTYIIIIDLHAAPAIAGESHPEACAVNVKWKTTSKHEKTTPIAYRQRIHALGPSMNGPYCNEMSSRYVDVLSFWRGWTVV